MQPKSTKEYIRQERRRKHEMSASEELMRTKVICTLHNVCWRDEGERQHNNLNLREEQSTPHRTEQN